MTSRDFCFWLQGYLEINRANGAPELPVLNTSQVRMIAEHLDLVFAHDIAPSKKFVAPPEILPMGGISGPTRIDQAEDGPGRMYC